LVQVRTLKIAFAVAVALVVIESAALAVVVTDKRTTDAKLRGSEQRADMVTALIAVSSKFQEELSVLDQATSEGAARLAGQDLNGSLARTVVNDTLASSEYAIDVLTCDRSGKVLAIGPEPWRWMSGTTLNANDPVVLLMDDNRPIVSGLFLTLEGFWAVTVAYPVVDSNGVVSGAISTLFRPDHMMENISRSLNGMSAMVQQSDGVILYDPDTTQVGKDVFTDPMFEDYPQVRTISSMMVGNTSGSGQYDFAGSGGTVTKLIHWTTVSALEARWSVAVHMAAA
jgi:hypothetical protein